MKERRKKNKKKITFHLRNKNLNKIKNKTKTKTNKTKQIKSKQTNKTHTNKQRIFPFHTDEQSKFKTCCLKRWLIIYRYQRFVCGWRASCTVAASSYRASERPLPVRAVVVASFWTPSSAVRHRQPNAHNKGGKLGCLADSPHVHVQFGWTVRLGEFFSPLLSLFYWFLLLFVCLFVFFWGILFSSLFPSLLHTEIDKYKMMKHKQSLSVRVSFTPPPPPNSCLWK